MHKRSLHLIALGLAVGLIWLTGAGGEFVWIDHVEIEEGGYRVTSVDDFFQVWTTSLDAYLERQHGELETKGGYLRPLYACSISLDWLLWKGNPFGYHVVNILWHGLVVWGLYVLGQQLLGQQKHARQLAFVAALLFAIHPLDMHSVTWISGRKDSMCAALGIFSLIALGKLFESELAGFSLHRTMCWMLTGIAALAAALFCKELALVVPPFALVWYWFKLPHPHNRLRCRTMLVALWMTAGLAVGYRLAILGGIGLGIDYPSDSWVNNLATSANLIVCYCGRIVAPLEPTIVDRWPIVQEIGLIQVGYIALLVLLTGFATFNVYRRKPIGLVLCWFLIWLLPASGIIPLRHQYAERYLYPASWGLILTIVLLTFHWTSNLKHAAWIQRATLAVFCIAFSILSISHNHNWSSDRTLFENAVRQDNQYVEGLSGLALLDLKAGDFSSSIKHSKAAIQSANVPGVRSYWSPFIVYSNAGQAEYRLKNWAQAILHFEAARKSRPQNSISHYHLGQAYVAAGELELGEQSYQQAIEISPEDHFSRNNLGHLFLSTGRYADCAEILTPTVVAQPENSLALANLGAAWLATENYPLAETCLEQYAMLNPQDGINLAKLAWCEFEQRKTAEAKQHLEIATRLAPQHSIIRFVTERFRQ